VLALALHELATNSVKYGALSVGTGALSVVWRSEGDRMTLRWTETGGPPVRKPKARGFGTKILEASINQQIAGQVTLDWRPTGLDCTLEIPCGTRPQPESIAPEQTEGAATEADGNVTKTIAPPTAPRATPETPALRAAAAASAHGT
jgi:hypothetical protein